jgi:eukaryotic-like serine/threonine-protein kinase
MAHSTKNEPIDESWFRRVEAIFHEIVDLPPDERSAAVLARTRDDPSIRERLQRMLQGSASSRGTTPLAEALLAQGAQAGALIGASLGHYRLVEFRGEGGFGEVYIAEQMAPLRRRVAVKVLHQDIATAIRRFELEVETLARMEHPAIARIFDAGTARLTLGETGDLDNGKTIALADRCFIAMEAIDGLPLMEYAEARELGATARIDLFARIIDGVMHAHQKGVIHRDLKPANVLIAELDGRAVPKIIDFGIAKAVDDASLMVARSAARDNAGTPRYMSPEQAMADRSRRVDSRSDVYSLGVMLSELLSEPQLDHAGYDDANRHTPAPSGQASRVAMHRASTPKWMRRDIDAIVAMATAERPDDRYASAAEFAADLRRLLDIRPVLAGNASASYRLRRWVRRQRLQAAMLVVVFVGAALAIGGIVRGASIAQEEAGRADRINDFLREVLTSVHPDRRGADVPFSTVLEDATALARDRFEGYPLAEADLREVLVEVNGNFGRIDAALREADRVEVIRSEVLGPDHPETLRAGLLVGRLHMQSGSKAALSALVERIGPQVRKSLGERSPAAAELEVLAARVLHLGGGTTDALTAVRATRAWVDAEGVSDRNIEALLTREEISYLRRLVIRNEPDPRTGQVDPMSVYALTRHLYELECARGGPHAFASRHAQVATAKAASAAGLLGESNRLAEELLSQSS